MRFRTALDPASVMVDGKPWRPSLPTEVRDQLDTHDEEAAERYPDLGPRHFDREGNPMSLADWVEAIDDNEYRVVAVDRVGDWEISTVWLGLDMGFGSALPLIFETMVFDNSEEGISEVEEIVERATGRRQAAAFGPDAYQNRYPTVAEARKGHEEALTAARAGLIRREGRT